MNISRRRAIGVSIVAIILAAMSVYIAGRLHVAAVRGWTALSYIPEPETSSKSNVRVTGSAGVFHPGSVVFLYPGSPAARAGIRWQDTIKGVNGIPTGQQKRLRALSDSVHSGDVITYNVVRNGAPLDIRVRFESPLRTTLFVVNFSFTVIVALLFAIIGTFVFWRMPGDARGVVFFVMTLIATVSLINSSMAQVDLTNARGIAVQQSLSEVGRYIAIATVGLFFAPLLLHLSLIFPTRRPVMVQHRRRTLTWVYGYPVYICFFLALFAVFVAVLSRASEASEKRVLRAEVIVGLSIIAVLTVIALIRLIMRRRKSDWPTAFIESPLASMTAVPALLSVMLVGLGVLASRTHSPTPMIVGGVAVVFLFSVTFGAYPVTTVITLYRSYRDSGIEERRQVKWPVWGTMVAVGGKLVLTVIGLAMGFLLSAGFLARFEITPVLMTAPDVLSKLLYILIPLSFAFAILKYRLMNIDVIIRRTVLYSILTFVVFALYAVVVASLGTALVKFAGMKSQTMLVASTVVIALAAVPIRNRLQQMVDRNLFRQKRDAALALRHIGDAIGGSSVEEFMRYCCEQIQQTLQNRLVIIAVRRDQEFVAAAKVGVADEIIGRVRTTPNDDSALRRLGATRIVPVRKVALLALGSKLSDEDFSAEDTEFLEAAAAQIAIGLENVRLRVEEVEFEQARAMQQILLPKTFPQLNGFDISGTWQPARSVGGDYFDTLTLSAHQAAICIADVAGKGMPAALLMANLQAAVKATASTSVEPAMLCERVKQIVGGNLVGGKFISFFYGTLDSDSHTFTYSNAGHNPPILARAGGDVERLDRGGPAICRLFRDVPQEQAVTQLAPGDRIVLFTDGASEARRGEEDFGDDRLIAVILRHPHLGARELQDRIMSELRDFTGGDFGDDVTLVVIVAR